jgi:DNA-binding transcriptional LysR family regulator
MELMQLEMFIAVVEERSFQKAGHRVFRSQPAVSLALRALERNLGMPLLLRPSRKSFQLTGAGEILYEYASRIIALRNEALSRLSGTPAATAADSLPDRNGGTGAPRRRDRTDFETPNVRARSARAGSSQTRREL